MRFKSVALRLAPFVAIAITTACGAGNPSSTTTPPPPDVKLQSISVNPAVEEVIVGSTQQLSAMGAYSDGSQKDVSGQVSWSTSNPVVATVNSAGAITGVASGKVTVTATSGTLDGTSALTVSVNVPTWHYDNQRSGLNPTETSLTPQSVNTASFGKLYAYSVDGYLYAQPLYAANIAVNGSTHNLVIAATEADSVYAFDADNFGDGTPLWRVNLLAAGETPLPNSTILPYEGITSTPTIDVASNTLYVLAVQSADSNALFRLHALDLTSGAEKFGGPVVVTASVPGTNSDSVDGVLSLKGSCVQRAALLLVNGRVILGFGSCHGGWLLAYDAQTLSQTAVFNTGPNIDGYGVYAGAGGIWMGGAGPAADAGGDIYVSAGNGPYDGNTAFGDSVMKFDSSLHLLDHFAPVDWAFLQCHDSDIGGGGVLLIPGTSQLVAAGKQGKIYSLNTANLGHLQANDAGATQELWFESDVAPPYDTTCTDNLNNVLTGQVNSYEVFGTSAWFNNSIYLGVTPTLPDVPAPVRQFQFANNQLAPSSMTTQSALQSSFGTTPFISADGNSNGIVWVLDHGHQIQASSPSPAVLRAYDATNLATEIYDSTQTSGDAPGFGIKFTSPIVANGKVFFGTARDPITAPQPAGELDVYGLRNGGGKAK